MGLKERLLGEEQRLVQGLFERLAQAGIFGPELGPQVVAIFVNDVVEGKDGM
jgi:hypothetical protein